MGFDPQRASQDDRRDADWVVEIGRALIRDAVGRILFGIMRVLARIV